MIREWIDYFHDLIYGVNTALEFVAGCDYEAFMSNREKQFAVIRALEIIGEAAKHIPKDIKKQHQNLPWREMTAMRNMVIHEYYGVDLETIYITVTEDLPDLKTQLQIMRTELKV